MASHMASVFALPCNLGADGSVDQKSSGNPVSYAPTRLNLFNNYTAKNRIFSLIWTAQYLFGFSRGDW
jgi:hypothetical protein